MWLISTWWVFDVHTGKWIDLKIDFEKYLKDIMEIYYILSGLKIKLHQLSSPRAVFHLLLNWGKAWELMILWDNIKQIYLGRPLV